MAETDPTARFQHIWHALMRVLGETHRVLRNRNRSIQHDIDQLMRGK